jgi:hypothetical protein
MQLYGTMILGFAVLAAMMADGRRDITVDDLAAGVAVGTAWFALCLAVLA